MYTPTRLKRWTMPSHYFGESWPNHYSAGVGQSRDSDCLEQSNFACMLAAIGGESEVVTVVHENHWAVGWVEWIAIEDDGSEESAAALKIADDCKEALDDYPVLDDDDFSRREWEAFQENWNNWAWKDFVKEIKSQYDLSDDASDVLCDGDNTVLMNFWCGNACTPYEGENIRFTREINDWDNNTLLQLFLAITDPKPITRTEQIKWLSRMNVLLDRDYPVPDQESQGVMFDELLAAQAKVLETIFGKEEHAS